MHVRDSRPVTPQDCDHCPAHRVDLFHGFDDADPAGVRMFCRIEEVARHGVIYSINEPGNSLFIVRSGLVKHVQYSSGGEERIVRLSGPGDALAMELMVDGVHHDTAAAVSPVNLCRIPLDLIDRRLREEQGFARRLMKQWQASLDDAERIITELSTGSAPERVARLLAFVGERMGVGHCLMLTREEMGALLGVTTETASRVVAEFKREGIIEEDESGCVRCSPQQVVPVAPPRGRKGSS